MICPKDKKEFINKKSFSNHMRWHKGLMEEAREKIKLSKFGSKNPQWKGEKVQYGSLHDYIKFHLPKLLFCQSCGKAKAYDLANISGEYKRDLTDWEWLCRKCHMIQDGRLHKFLQIGRGRHVMS